jgi:hypothetical protein
MKKYVVVGDKKKNLEFLHLFEVVYLCVLAGW